MTIARRDRLWLAVAALTLLGLVLRLLAARGALWLDEAWSAAFAEQAATPIGVVWRINHDNNHILNTLWLQVVGPDAPPMLQRALAIATGTVAIPLAAAFGARRGAAAALIAALAFAVSPILVTYGSEARGYAPMIAAFVGALMLVDRWLAADGAWPAPAIGLAILSLLGTLAQAMMVAPVLAIVGWAGVVLWQRHGFGIATRRTLAALGPALAACAFVLLVMALAARASPHGFTIGAYTPFRLADWTIGIAEAARWTLGIGAIGRWAALVGLAAAALLLANRRRDPRALFYLVMIVAFPLAFALFQVGNVATPRFYLTSMAAFLLLSADALGAMTASPGRRWAAAALIALFAIGAARLDMASIASRRGDPAAAIAAMRVEAPAGTSLMLPDRRLVPVFDQAARNAHYRLHIAGTSCSPAPFLILDNDHPAADPSGLRLCCGSYRLVTARHFTGLSGTNWWLYRRLGP